jgi:hypothetical protein
LLYVIWDYSDIIAAVTVDGALLQEWELPGGEQEGVTIIGCRIFVTDDSGPVMRYGFWGVQPVGCLTCPGDFDGDRSVGLGDLAVLLGNFGLPPGIGSDEGDLDGDGRVELGDLSIFLSYFGATCP